MGKEMYLAVLLFSGLLAASCVGTEKTGGDTGNELAEGGLNNGSFHARLNGFRIHYEIYGSGPVLMVVPNSWGITASMLRQVYRGLEKKLTLVYFDPRGMGESDPIREDEDMGLAAVRKDFDALRSHLGLEKVFAAGWSNGAVNLIQLAAEYPKNISAAIFIHGMAAYSEKDIGELLLKHPEIGEKYARFLQEMGDESISDQEKNSRLKTLWLKDWFPLICADPNGAKEMLSDIFGTAEFSWKHVMYQGEEVPTFDFRDQLPGIRIPCLVIAGAHDTIPVDSVRALQEGLPDARLAVFESSGHFAPREEPEAFENLVFEFLGVQ